jgi:hypothetical protein
MGRPDPELEAAQKRAANAQVESARFQREQVEKQNREAQAKKEALQTEATDAFNAKRRGQIGRKSLITTSETGVLGSTSKLG